MPPDVVIDVRVIPRARTTEFGGERHGAYLVRLAAPPVDGAANAALIAFLADAFGLPRRAVRIVGGERGRAKRVAIEGMPLDRIRATIARCSPTSSSTTPPKS
jgi:uncharacterized protein (TIGR00251 family)